VSLYIAVLACIALLCVPLAGLTHPWFKKYGAPQPNRHTDKERDGRVIALVCPEDTRKSKDGGDDRSGDHDSCQE
jgi:hypothetical protein